MPIAIHFTPRSMTGQQYDEIIARLDAAGAGSPRGRLYHASYGAPAGPIRVFDVWDSQESFEQFGKTLMPILQNLGVDPGTPDVAEVRKIIVGS